MRLFDLASLIALALGVAHAEMPIAPDIRMPPCQSQTDQLALTAHELVQARADLAAAHKQIETLRMQCGGGCQ